jgi:hypothetical protein
MDIAELARAAQAKRRTAADFVSAPKVSERIREGIKLSLGLSAGQSA